MTCEISLYPEDDNNFTIGLSNQQWLIIQKILGIDIIENEEGIFVTSFPDEYLKSIQNRLPKVEFIN
jgi:hypothetical protein